MCLQTAHLERLKCCTNGFAGAGGLDLGLQQVGPSNLRSQTPGDFALRRADFGQHGGTDALCHAG